MAKCEKIIAVIGVSEDETKYGFKIFRDLAKAGCTVYGVNPKGGNILGRAVCKTFGELPVTPELVITVVPAAVTEQVVEECIRLGVKSLWMQPGSESDAAIEKARVAGIAVTARACFMVNFGFW